MPEIMIIPNVLKAPFIPYSLKMIALRAFGILHRFSSARKQKSVPQGLPLVCSRERRFAMDERFIEAIRESLVALQEFVEPGDKVHFTVGDDTLRVEFDAVVWKQGVNK